MSDTKLNEAQNIATPPERLIELVGMSTELARAVATNLNAPPKLLERLSKFDDIETRKNVALNPNTATNILFKLGKDFPEEFLNNPVLTLLLLENPYFVETIPSDTVIQILRITDNPIFVKLALKAPSSHPNYTDWHLAIASNPNTTKEILLQIYKESPKTNIAQAALLHVNWNGEIISDWHEAAFIEIRTCGYIWRDKIKEQLLQDLGIIPKHLRPYSEKLRHVVNLDKYSIRTYKYIDLLNRVPLASQLIREIVDNFKSASRTDASILFFLVSPYWFIQYIIKVVFKNKIKTSIVLFILTLLTIINPLASIAFFKLMLTLTYVALIFLLSFVVSGLFGLITGYILIALILLGIIVFKYIINKFHLLTKNYKQKRLEEKILSKYNSDIYKQDLIAAINPNTSPVILLELASSRWLYVREAVATNPNADANVLNKLLEDEPYKLKVLVANHLNTPVELLTKFAKHYGAEVKIAVAQNIKTPLSTLKYLALCSKKYEPACSEAIKTIKKCYPEELTNILVAYVEKTTFPSAARLFLLLHATAPSDFLTRHYRSLDWRERYAVAQNLNTPINILEKLRLDANCIVRATAKARF